MTTSKKATKPTKPTKVVKKKRNRPPRKYREFPKNVTAADLGNLFNKPYNEVREMIKGIPCSTNQTYNLTDVIKIVDNRVTPNYIKSSSNVDDPLPALDTSNMSTPQLKVYYQAKVERENYILKHLKNEETAGGLIPVNDVSLAINTTFKTLVNFLDLLPDIVERKGLLHSNQISPFIKILDVSRQQLASSLTKLESKYGKPNSDGEGDD